MNHARQCLSMMRAFRRLLLYMQLCFHWSCAQPASNTLVLDSLRFESVLQGDDWVSCQDVMRGIRRRDRSDRATVEGVLDPRTKATLMRMVRNRKLLSIHGCRESSLVSSFTLCLTDLPSIIWF